MGPSTGSAGGGMGGASRPDPAAAYQAGVTALQAHDYRAAIRNFREARRAAPNDSQINFALGLAYVGAGENDDARGALERAVRDENGPPGAPCSGRSPSVCSYRRPRFSLTRPRPMLS